MYTLFIWHPGTNHIMYTSGLQMDTLANIALYIYMLMQKYMQQYCESGVKIPLLVNERTNVQRQKQDFYISY